MEGIDHPEMVLVRSLKGINITVYNPLTREEEGEEKVFAVFYLISPEKDPTQHLRILAQIAGRVDHDSFSQEWVNAGDEIEMKEALLHDESFLSIELQKDSATAELISKSLSLYQFIHSGSCVIDISSLLSFIVNLNLVFSSCNYRLNYSRSLFIKALKSLLLYPTIFVPLDSCS